MERLDFDNIQLKETYNIPNEEAFYVKYIVTKLNKEYTAIVDKDLNIIGNRTKYINYVTDILGSFKAPITEQYIISNKFGYIPEFDLYYIHISQTSQHHKFICIKIYKVYEDLLLYHYEINTTINDNFIYFKHKNINEYINYSNIIISKYLLNPISIIDCILSEEFISIIDTLYKNKDNNCVEFYKYVNGSVFEFTILKPIHAFSIYDCKIYNDLSLYNDYTYIIFTYITNHYIIKINPDFSEYDFINISEIMKKECGKITNEIFILFNELIIEMGPKKYQININKLFEDTKYNKIHKTGNIINEYLLLE